MIRKFGWAAAGLLAAVTVAAAVDTASLPKPAYNGDFSFWAELNLTDALSETSVSLLGGGGNASVKDVRKGVRVTLEGTSLTVTAAGKDGNPMPVAGPYTVSVPGRVRVAVAVDNSETGTGVTVCAAVTGNPAAVRDLYNFDNAAHSQGLWSANAPFDIWSVTETVVSLAAVSEAWTEEQLTEKVAMTPPAVTSGTVTFSDKTADKGPLTLRALERQTYGATAWEAVDHMTSGGASDGTVLTPNVNVQTGGRWRATFAASEALSFRTVTLQVPTFNSSGEPQTEARTAVFRLYGADGTALASSGEVSLTGGTLKASAEANTVELEAEAVQMLAEGETVTLVCERGNEQKGCFVGLQSLSFTTEKSVTPDVTVAVGTAVLTAEEGQAVNWTDASWLLASGGVGTLPDGVMPVILWRGGTVTVPAGTEVSAFRASEAGTGVGTLQVSGALVGVDDGCPAVPAFGLPVGVTVVLEPGARLAMDGRLPATVEVAAATPDAAAVMLEARSEGATLRLDRLILPAPDARPPTAARNIELYGAHGFGLGSADRWDYDGFRMLLK